MSVFLKSVIQGFVLLAAAASALAATGGGVVGNGGSYVINPDTGQYESADKYFEAHHYQLPSQYGPRLDLASKPELIKEINRIVHFIEVRAGRGDEAFFTIPLKDYEVYVAPTLVVGFFQCSGSRTGEACCS
jgi:hypothetical protein